MTTYLPTYLPTTYLPPTYHLTIYNNTMKQIQQIEMIAYFFLPNLITRYDRKKTQYIHEHYTHMTILYDHLIEKFEIALHTITSN